ncbi:protein O-linked-mannose beta-1,2-N-acetylglucosaminyltransferase 1-like [Homarus americanus]|uniref:protein O-linked-mannose beta-1,2-N-acetylglucosaminyltransferase 1-like n=1 Tax=Homarus americanus TaxID=6706 RepID=UPI001C45C481|nr:protein O-linked-mannose beta-1,2-N-acetylglucosaminyltransferase 1-like [Homarus americanus]
MSTRKLGRVILLAASVSVYLTGVQVVLEETLAQHPGAETFNNGQPHQQQEVKSRGRLTKRLHTTQEVPRPLQGGTDHLVLEARLEASGVTVWVDGVQVYRLFNKTLPWADNLARLHAGVHLLTLHERSGQVMRAATYLTWQPENNRQLSQALNDARDGRLLLLLATPEFTMFLGQEVVEQLKSLGSNFADRLAKYESWCLVAQKGVGVLHEVLTTVTHSLGSQAADASPTFLQLMVPLTQERQCGWYGEAGMRERATFCETYDGYGDFCSCDDPPWSPVPKNSVEYPVQEVIPVAIVTAHRLPHVLRQVGQAWASPGGTNTPITIYVDGHNPEARALGALLNVPVVEHDNPVPLGSSARVNEHIKFAVREVFEGHPTANLAIILEDDLDLAPDFIPYFHQTAPLLTSDPYLMFVNAFNYNSYAHTAYDPRRLYRAHGIPGYGWMTTRQGAAEMLANWVPVNQTNAVWDWWVRAKVMRDKDMLMPEVPRTRHMGGGGTHISGFDQVLFSSQPLNNLSLVQLDVGSAKEGNYEFHIRKEMSSAQVVTLTHHPSGHTTTHAQDQQDLPAVHLPTW